MSALSQKTAASIARTTRLAEAIGGRLSFTPQQLFTRDLTLQPTKKSISPNGFCHIMQTSDGWLAVNLAREDDRAALPAWLESDLASGGVRGVLEGGKRGDWLERAIALHLPVSLLGEAAPASWPRLENPANAQPPPRILDLSALWAGPLAAGLLAQAGAMVEKLESLARPDPTARSTPQHDAWLNGAKQRSIMPFTPDILLSRIAQVDMLVTSARPHALARLGLNEAAVFAANPQLIWLAITAHGWRGDAGMRVGFGDDCAVAGGLVEWVETEPERVRKADWPPELMRGKEPVFKGDALADPLTGLAGAEALLSCWQSGECGRLIDLPLAGVAAAYAQNDSK